MDKEKDNKFDELYRLISITAKARYRASTRLSLHGMWSQWTLSLLAIGLIIVSVIILSGMPMVFSEQYTNVMQVIFSVVVLTYSLLLGMGNFSARAERLLRCGMELSRIVRKVKPYKAKEDDKHDIAYEDLVREYYDCLEKYENHKDIDYLSSSLEIARRKGFPTKDTNDHFFIFILKYADAIFSRAKLWLSIRGRYTFAFSHYLLSLFLVYGWIILDINV